MAGIFGFEIYKDKYNPISITKTLLNGAKQNFNHISDIKYLLPGKAALGFAMPYGNSFWPLKSRDGRYYFQLFGEIILPNGKRLDHINFQDNFLIPYLKSPDDFLHQLKGAFVFILFDKQNYTFTLINDPFGNFSLYYYIDREILLISSQLHSIRNILKMKQWDEKGLGQYLGLGYTMNGVTLYRDIKRVQAAEKVVLSLNNTEKFYYFIPEYSADDNVKGTIEKIKTALITSIDLQLRNYSDIGAALTGGFDSRVTWAVIRNLGNADRVTAFTHGLKNSRDIRIAKRIAANFNLNHKIKIFDDVFIKSLPDVWSSFVFMTEGLVPVTAAHATASWNSGKNSYEMLLDSHGGALYRRQFMKVARKRISDSLPFTDQFFKFNKSGLLKLDILKSDIRREAEKHSLNGLYEYFTSIKSNKNTSDKIDLFYIHQISANKYSVSGNVQMNWLRLSHPFLDPDAFKAVQTIPAKYRHNQSIYKYIIDQADKEMKEYSLENMGMPAPYRGFTYLRYGPMIYERLLQKSLAKVSKPLYDMLTLRHFTTDYDLFFRLNFYAVKEILTNPNQNFFVLVDEHKLESLIRRVEHDQTYRLSTLSELITLKLYFDLLY